MIAPLTLLELNNRLNRAISDAPGLQNVWVVAETSDLRISGAHCYLELIDKDSIGITRARMRATIWGSNFQRINASFRAATGTDLASNIKIMVLMSVTYHPIYGLSANITDVNPEYTLGDLLRRRREMIAKLEELGILNQNRELPWPEVPWRIAVISAPGAAGYGDFINQIYTNRHNLRFSTQLFPAVMQGENTAPSIMSALEKIAALSDKFDCVVIIRGGGATGDLAAFDHYELAANMALFPLPVIVGIGHERDVTLLDYVANLRVKTPTAAAEWLIGRGADALERLRQLGNNILDAASARIHGAGKRIELIVGQIPELALNVISRHKMMVGKISEDRLVNDCNIVLRQNSERLKSLSALVDTLLPEATLRRGFSITRVDNKAITSPEQVASGATVVTTLASGTLTTVKP